MTFASIPHASSVFIDANTLVYHFTAHPQYGIACKNFVERIARKEIQGITSAHVVGDVAHRIMTLEAIAQFGWAAKGIAQRLRKNPGAVQRMSQFRQAVQETARLGIQVVSIDLHLMETAAAMSQQHGLLTGDALVIAVMQSHGLSMLASEDSDF